MKLQRYEPIVDSCAVSNQLDHASSSLDNNVLRQSTQEQGKNNNPRCHQKFFFTKR